jgi:hypothetical protein
VNALSEGLLLSFDSVINQVINSIINNLTIPYWFFNNGLVTEVTGIKLSKPNNLLG